MLDREDREIYHEDKVDRRAEAKDVIEAAKDIKEDIIDNSREAMKEVREDYRDFKHGIKEDVRAEDKAEKELLKDTE